MARRARHAAAPGRAQQSRNVSTLTSVSPASASYTSWPGPPFATSFPDAVVGVHAEVPATAALHDVQARVAPDGVSAGATLDVVVGASPP